MADTFGVDDNLMKRVMQIESGGNPNARTGSYKGLYQLSDDEFNKYGGGDIYNPQDNSRAAQNKFAAESDAFAKQHGRQPSATDLYLTHQQGAGGYAAHMNNPDAPAWQNMASTAEGRQKGEAWAKQAIWGNVPDQHKAQYGSVDNLTSKQFVDLWRNKVEGNKKMDDNRFQVPSPEGLDQSMYQKPPALSAQAIAGGRGMYGLSDGMITKDGAPQYDLGNSMQNAGAWLMGIHDPKALGALATLKKGDDAKVHYDEKTGSFFRYSPKGGVAYIGKNPNWDDAEARDRQKAYDKTSDEQFTKLYGDIQGRGADAQNDLALVQQAKDLLSKKDANGNHLVDQGFAGELGLQAKSLYKALGGNPSGLAEGQTANALMNQLTLKIKNAGGTNTMPGSLSDRDLTFLANSNASLGKDPAANAEILDKYERSLKRSQSIAELARTHNGGRLDNSFYDKVSEHDRKQAEQMTRKSGMDAFWLK